MKNEARVFDAEVFHITKKSTVKHVTTILSTIIAGGDTFLTRICSQLENHP